MWARREQFPIVEQEIGDSWIHGAATDPHKLARFRALQRMYDAFEVVTPERQAFGRGLTMVAEHTWGVDIKTYLRDETAWDRTAFEAARAVDYRFAYAEQSWAEQRGYLDAALSHLTPADRITVDIALSALEPPSPPFDEPRSGTRLENSGWVAELDEVTGDITRLVAPDGRMLEGVKGSLLAYRHESFDWAELQHHLDSYLQHRQDWAILDHDKPGLRTARTSRTAAFAPAHLGISPEECAVSELPPDARTQLGGPARQELSIRGLDQDRVEVTLVLRDKPANRMPEAGFFNFSPAGANNWHLRKMGLWHEGQNIVRRGGGQLQAVEAVRATIGATEVEFTLLDAALIAPIAMPFMPFQSKVPDYSEGVRVNLYNNKWGTNFPMWWEGTAVFRVIVALVPSAP